MPISRYSTPIEQTLEKYVPVPMDSLYKAAEAIQQRGDLAEQQIDTAQYGLASIGSNPYHQDFINNYVKDFNNKSSELLAKYNGNSSNPEFEKESKRLIRQYASDPRLKTVQQAKLAYDQKQADKSKLDMMGVKYIDTNPTYNGLDNNGKLSTDVGQLRQVNYDKIIADRISQAAKGIEQRGSLRSNQWNIAGTADSLKQQKFVDPELALGVQHLMQTTGATQEQASAIMDQYIDTVSKSMISSDIDHFKESQDWDKFKYFDTRRRENEKTSPSEVPSLGTYFVPTSGEKDKLGDNEIPLAGKSNVSFNKPFQGVLTGERFVFKEGRFNDSAERKTDSVNIKDGTFVNVSVPYIINDIEGSNSSKYTSKKGELLTKDTGWWTSFGSDGSTESTDIQKDKNGRQFVYLDKDRKVKGYVQPQAFAVYKDNESDATIYKKLNRDETLTYLGPRAGKLSNDGYDRNIYESLDANTKVQVLETLKLKGYDVNTLSPSELNTLTQTELDAAYYKYYKAPLFEKPGTTEGILNYYIGK